MLAEKRRPSHASRARAASGGVFLATTAIRVAIWAILSSVAEMIAAVSLRREIEGERVLFLVGVLSVALGVAMAVLPGVGVLSLVWLVGLYALTVGVALIVLAFRVRDVRKRGSRRVR